MQSRVVRSLAAWKVNDMSRLVVSEIFINVNDIIRNVVDVRHRRVFVLLIVGNRVASTVNVDIVLVRGFENNLSLWFVFHEEVEHMVTS